MGGLLDPDSPFMRGYTRDPDMAERLVSAIRAAMYAHPTQRLGQIIDNALKMHGIVLNPGILFNVHDETLIEALEAYTAHVQ